MTCSSFNSLLEAESAPPAPYLNPSKKLNILQEPNDHFEKQKQYQQ